MACGFPRLDCPSELVVMLMESVRLDQFEPAAMRQPIIEIVAIGNELLIGKTLDTNSHWLAVQIGKLGGELRRITTVRDQHVEIASAVSDALSRHPDFLITLGGLGPTHDDITLQSISKLLKRRLALNPAALDFLRRRYMTRFGPSAKLTPPRIKMARFPKGAFPLPNPAGTAPAPCLKVHETTLVSLPGVPKEMRAIFRGSVAHMIEKFGGTERFHEHSLMLRGIPESTLSPTIDHVMHQHPKVYIKSHPRGIEKNGAARIELHFRTSSKSSKESESELQRSVALMKRRLRGRALVRDMRGS